MKKTLTFLLMAVLLSFTVNAASGLYLSGDIPVWGEDDCTPQWEFFDPVDGVYTLLPSGTDEFITLSKGIKVASKGWSPLN